MCIDPQNTNSKAKLIYLSCSMRNVQKTSYFCLIDKNDKNMRFFGHFLCCLRVKLIWSLNLCYGDQCTFFDRFYKNMCIDPQNTNSKAKLIYLSCSMRNVQKTSYFCLIDKNDKNMRFFGHFLCCLRVKLIWSLNLCYGDQCTFFDRLHAITLRQLNFFTL